MRDFRELEPLLARIPGVQVACGVPLAKHTSLGVGGPADLFVQVSSLEALESVLRLCDQEACPILVLGAGTNLLVMDAGVEGAVVSLDGAFKEVAFTEEASRVFADAGAAVRLPRLLHDLEVRGLGGLEYATGVPGSVGGAVVMNAGTRHGYIEGDLVSVRLVSAEGAETVAAARLHLGYRTSDIPERAVIASARFVLSRERSERQAWIVEDLKAHRRDRQPPMRGTAGSFFKNPDIARGVFAGRLIEEAGLKGTRRGGAFVSEVHANFLTNGGDASARDLLELAVLVRERVLERFGVALHPEVRIVGRGAAEWIERLAGARGGGAS